ncbi:MAG: MFS transporter, partial [Betaproteobacteria bacterium]
MTRSTVWRLVPALGVTQIISWGTLYYSIAVLGASIREELGISSAALFGAYSLSLLLSALVA